jgi:hypothetical protein
METEKPDEFEAATDEASLYVAAMHERPSRRCSLQTLS